MIVALQAQGGKVACSPLRLKREWQDARAAEFDQTRSITIAIPCPTPMHIVHRA
jgi:hypothetical protein